MIFCWLTAVLTRCLVALPFHQRIPMHSLPTEDALYGIFTTSNLMLSIEYLMSAIFVTVTSQDL